MSDVLVSGALANKIGNGGGAWERLSWATGLRRLGYDVYFVEQIAAQEVVDHCGQRCPLADSVNLAWFRRVTEWFGLAERSALVDAEQLQTAGLPWQRLLELADHAAALINLSGHLTLPPLVERIACQVYVDVDPGFTQIWHADPQTAFQIAPHDFYFTVGANIGTPDSPIPTGGLAWRPTRQPVVLDDWPVVPSGRDRRFSTIASWRGPYGPLEFGGRTLGLKCHEFRKFIELPAQSSLDFEVALSIHPADEKDRAALCRNGWRLVDPLAVAGTPAGFRSYVQQSSGEFSVAQGVYVDTNSGWFSDRTVRYLASGKPALVQETGFSKDLPAGLGLVSFRTMDDAIAGAQSIAADNEAHCRAARAIAEEYFDSDHVLGRLMQEIGVAP